MILGLELGLGLINSNKIVQFDLIFFVILLIIGRNYLDSYKFFLNFILVLENLAYLIIGECFDVFVPEVELVLSHEDFFQCLV